MNELLEFYKQGKIKPSMYQSFKMNDFVSAFNVFKERKVMGKITLEIKHESGRIMKNYPLNSG